MDNNLSPYSVALAREKRVCLECLSYPLRLEPLPVPSADLATEVCDKGGYFCILAAPEVWHKAEKRKVKIVEATF